MKSSVKKDFQRLLAGVEGLMAQAEELLDVQSAALEDMEDIESSPGLAIQAEVEALEEVVGHLEYAQELLVETIGE